MSSAQGYGPGAPAYGAAREPGARRRRLAEMAGNIYRTGASAVSEIRESYNQSRAPDFDSPELSRITIPGSFPDVSIVTRGREQMVLFPSYAKRHVRNQQGQFDDPNSAPQASSGAPTNEQDYWQHEWARHEDEKAVVDVDVRGWIYNPHRGAITRRNRMLIGLARQLSGIPAPGTQQNGSSGSGAAGGGSADPYGPTSHQQREAEREQQSIARQAREIEKRGQVEEETAEKGGYSEYPDGRGSLADTGRIRSGYDTPPPAPASPAPPGRANTGGGSELNDAELAVANANLMARLAPFLTTPLVEVPITLFFYNDTQSQSRTVMTNDSGHFATRAALDFVPTHVRVLASEGMSCTETIQVIEPTGISMISDIDDTIKRSNIALGAKEIFRNTFIRDLQGMTVGGVKELYSTLHDMGVKIHYCSNSPWQLYPVLATFFKMAGLPPGSLHLKQYTGMLQGIFEPVAERKKGTLERIMRDFPERRFLLVGDSGEADLEVYTELAVAYPKRIIAIFIRDVTTPDDQKFFDPAFDAPGASGGPRQSTLGSLADFAPALPPRRGGLAVGSRAAPAAEGDLIDFSDERPSSLAPSKTQPSEDTGSPATSASVVKKPPPRPAKPASLQSSSPASTATCDQGSLEVRKAPPPPQPRRTTPSSVTPRSSSSSGHPLAQVSTASSGQLSDIPHRPAAKDAPRPAYGRTASNSKILPPPQPPPRRRGTPSSVRSTSPQLLPGRRRTGDSEVEPEPSSSEISRKTTPVSRPESPNTARRVELWQRRLQRAQDTLDHHGVVLYTWRHGDDVKQEAIGLVREQLKKMNVWPETSRKG